jgi:hypothetical protein
MEAQGSGTLAPGREESASLDPRTERQLADSLRLIPRETDGQIKLDLPIMSRFMLNRLVREQSIDHCNPRRRVAQWLTTRDSGLQ